MAGPEALMSPAGGLARLASWAVPMAARSWAGLLGRWGPEGADAAMATDPCWSGRFEPQSVGGGEEVRPAWRRASNQREIMLAHASCGNVAGVRDSLSGGVDADARSPGGSTPLMIAATQQGHCSVARALLGAGAGVNLASPSGNTALIFAAARGNVQVSRLLLRWGADASSVNREGLNAEAMARRHGHSGIAEELRQ